MGGSIRRKVTKIPGLARRMRKITVTGLLLGQDHDLQLGQDLDPNHLDGEGSLSTLRGFMCAIFPMR